jgi:hypothetical protein
VLIEVNVGHMHGELVSKKLGSCGSEIGSHNCKKQFM